MTASQPPLTLDGARELVERSTFKLQLGEYCKKFPKWPGMVGLEIETIPVLAKARDAKGRPLPASMYAAQGLAACGRAPLDVPLRALAQRRDYREQDHADMDFPALAAIVMDVGDQITFEPGGQVEFSSIPYPCLSDAVKRLRSVQQQLDDALGEAGIKLVQMGVNPWHELDEIGLQVQKRRYIAMNDYFAEIGPYGQRMMRQSATVQVNLDFGTSEQTLADRFLASMLIAPFVAATFSYSSILAGKLAKPRGFRTEIWRHVDPLRTGFPALDGIAKRRSKEACVESYLALALAAPVIFLPRQGYRRPPRGLTFGKWIAEGRGDDAPTESDLQTHMSLLFPEVRARGFLELRSVDCQARPWQEVPAAYWTGILYDDENVEKVLERFLPELPQLTEWMAKASSGFVDAKMSEHARFLMNLAAEGFDRLPSCFKGEGVEQRLMAFRKHFTERGIAPGDELAERFAKAGELSLALIEATERDWMQLIV